MKTDCKEHFRYGYKFTLEGKSVCKVCGVSENLHKSALEVAREQIAQEKTGDN